MRYPSFARIDENADGSVDAVELLDFFRDALDTEGEEDKGVREGVYLFAKSLFEMSDVDRNGVLCPTELEFSRWLTQSTLSSSAIGQGAPVGTLAAYDLDFASAALTLKRVDTNGDGVVDVAECWTSARKDLESWGWDDDLIGREIVRDWFTSVYRVADANGDGVLQGREMLFASYLVFCGVAQELAGTMMLGFDLDRDGRISLPEIVKALLESGPKGFSVVLEEDFADADADGDGFLNDAEAAQLAKSVLFADSYIL